MKLKEIIEIIEKEFPTENACEWDNVGLLVGDRDREVKKVLVTLDVNRFTLSEAILCGADLILSHHPILFSPASRITADTEEGALLLSAIENKISIYAAHTNCDVAPCGINAYLAELFALREARALEESGLGRIGNLEKEMCFDDFAQLVKEKLKTPHIRVCGDTKIKVKRVAIGSGACSDSVPRAIEMGADVMITGDTKYHEALTFADAGITVIDAGHFPTEAVVCDIFEKLLAGTGVAVVKSQNTDVFKYI